MSRVAGASLQKFRFGNNSVDVMPTVDQAERAEVSSFAMKLLILFLMFMNWRLKVEQRKS